MDPNGTPSPAFGTGDVELQSRWMRYQEAFEFAPDCQLVTDGSGIIIEANHAAAALFRQRKEFLIGKPLAFFAAPGRRSRFYACLGNLSRGNPLDAFTSQINRRDDSAREVNVVARTGGRATDEQWAANVYWANTVHWIIRDITEWQRTHKARNELQRRLTTAREDEQRRIARDLHDTVSQTLTALVLGVRAARDSAELPEITLQHLDHIQRLADDLAKQVHELA